MAVYLDRILARHRELAAGDTEPLDALIDQARAVELPMRGFRRALAADHGLSVIAEMKRRSPSKGPLAPDLDPGQVARDYEQGGARALSVLTDVDFFGGSAADLVAARDGCAVPVLRKDFTVAAADVCRARLMGADAVLVIVAAVDDTELAEFTALAAELDLDALVEVHDRDELERALGVGADLIGVNQRDLKTFSVDRARAAALATDIPAGVISVAESGIDSPGDLAPLRDSGYDAVLVGEAVVTAEDRAGAVATLVAG